MDAELTEELSRRGCRIVERLLPRLVVVPEDEDAVSELIRLAALKRLRVCPAGSGSSFPVNYQFPEETVFLLLNSFNQIVDLRLSDAMITIQAGMSAAELAKTLDDTELQVPSVLKDYPGTVGGALLTPDEKGIRREEFRRRLLRVKLIDARGRILQFGSLAIKNVAGYDYWSFLIGSGGRFGVLLEISLNLEKMPPVIGAYQAVSTQRREENPAQWIYANLCKSLDPDGIFVR
jgi:FAD/FMN-containing dehydrogenase